MKNSSREDCIESIPGEREKAHRLCKLYNDTFDTDTELRAKILYELLPNSLAACVPCRMIRQMTEADRLGDDIREDN